MVRHVERRENNELVRKAIYRKGQRNSGQRRSRIWRCRRGDAESENKSG